jgi:thiamine biosynthesis lipoprotein
MSGGTTRRKLISVIGAAVGMALIPFGARHLASAGNLVEWRGVSLGAVATIRIHHPNRDAAQRLIEEAVGEAGRLEAVFSLYQHESTLCELNRRQVLVAPPTALADILALCDRFWRATDGIFDPTVQPLWQCYANHFSKYGPAAAPPSAGEKAKALELVGWQKLGFDRDEIVFERQGMGLTLNGVAQGYITDRVVDRLRAGGIENCLVDMGEIRGIGRRPDGRPWEAAIENPAGEIAEDRSVRLLNKAIATSSAGGFKFDAEGRSNHLFDPRTGTCASPSRTLSVIAETAATADALSTAFALMDEHKIKEVVRRLGKVEARITTSRETRKIS